MLIINRWPSVGMVDERDSKSRALTGIPVRVRGGPPLSLSENYGGAGVKEVGGGKSLSGTVPKIPGGGLI